MKTMLLSSTLLFAILLNSCALVLAGDAGDDISEPALFAGAALLSPVMADGDTPDASGAGVPAADPGSDDPPAGRFTGPAAHGMYPDDITTSDSFSGLTWTACASGQSGLNCAGAAGTLTHAAAISHCSGLNSANGGAGFAGRSDWRLPSVKELSTILDYETNSPAIASAHFPNTFHVLAHWTADIYPSATGFAYGVGFKYGTVGPNIRTGGLYTRCVAGTFASVSNFTDQGDGTVRDTSLNLMWTRCTLDAGGTPANGSGFDCAAPAGFHDWTAAANACANLSFAGHGDWRLPTIAELKSLIDETAFDPAAYTMAFPNIPAGAQYWSATEYDLFASDAWRLDSRYGQVSPMTKSTGAQVRCVRDD